MRNSSTEQNGAQAECVALRELTFGGGEGGDRQVGAMDFHGENKAVKGPVRLSWAILNGVIREGLTEVT